MYLVIISGLAAFLLILIFLAIKSLSKDKKSQKELYKMLEELTAQVREKNDALKAEIEKSAPLIDELNNLRQKSETQAKKIETKLNEDTENKKLIEKLKIDFAAKEKQLRDNAELLNKSVSELNRIKELLKNKDVEFASLSEAHGGLKEQYDELEDQLVKLNQENIPKSSALQKKENNPVVKVDKPESSGLASDSQSHKDNPAIGKNLSSKDNSGGIDNVK